MVNCYQHPNRETETLCDSCAKAMCDDCKYKLGNQFYCKECIESVLTPGEVNKSGQTAERVALAGYEMKSKVWTFLLSLIPGVGYLYLGLMKRGLQTLLTFFGTIFVGNLIGLEQIIVLVLPVLMFYTIFDAQQALRQMNAGFNVEDRELFSLNWLKIEERWIGYALIGLGALALLNNALPMLFATPMFRAIVGPLVIIAAGVYILVKNSKVL